MPSILNVLSNNEGGVSVMLCVFEEDRVVIAKYTGPVREELLVIPLCCQKQPVPAARSAFIASCQ